MGDTQIVYEPFGIDTFKKVICAELGEAFWQELIQGLKLPDINTERDCGCRNMRGFMERFEAIADADTVKEILYKVRHGLRVAQSQWARKEFLAAGDLDSFLKSQLESEIMRFEKLNRDNMDFYGQDITDEVLVFVKQNPSMLTPERRGNRLYCMAFPCNMKEYINAHDSKMKRYYACHCPFAKESMLSDKPVSATLCNCSLGHVMNFVEAFLDRPLKGRVLTSVLNGDMYCTYEIDIPDDIMDEYVREK